MKFRVILVLLFLLTTVPVSAQEPETYKVYLPYIGRCDIGEFESMSSWKVIVPESTINMVLNPSAEIAGNYTAEAGTTAAPSATYGKYGLYSYRVQTDADNEGIEITLSALTNAIHYVTMRVRGTLPAAWDWSLDDATYNAPTLIEAIDADWNLYGFEFPAAQANASVKLSIHQNGAGAGDFYIDGIQVEAKGYWTTYCDGTQDGCAWNGAANKSSSTRSALSRAGGRIYDLEDDYSLDIGGIIGAGTPLTLTDDAFAGLPGGMLNSVKVESGVMTLTGVIRGTSVADFHAKRQTLIELFAHDAYPKDANGWQPVRLRYTGAAVQKEIEVHYESGLAVDIRATEVCYWERVAIRFFLPDPLWSEIGNSSSFLDSNDTPTMRYVAGRLVSTGQWDDLGLVADPIGGGGVYAILAASNGLVYFGGIFTGWAGNAGWDYLVSYNPITDTWARVGGASDLDGTVWGLVEGADGTIYVCGQFEDAGGVGDADFIAAWDPVGESWSALGAPSTGATIDTIYCMAFNSVGELYVGGYFANLAGIAAADGVAMWDGTNWNAVGAPAINNPYYVYTIAIDNDDYVYIGGTFINAGGVAAADDLAFWNGTAWAAVGGVTPSNPVYSLYWDEVHRLLYIGGVFTNLAGIAEADKIAVWNGTSFSALGNGLTQNVFGIAADRTGRLWVVGAANMLQFWTGGVWTTADLVESGSTFRAVRLGVYDPVVQTNVDLYVGITGSGAVEVAGATLVTNEGTSPVHPIIQVTRTGGTGATLYSIRNETLGVVLLFSYALLDGETLTINLTPTQQSVKSSMFGDRPHALLANSDKGEFVLNPGVSNITALVTEAGAPTVVAGMTFEDRYRSLD